MLGRVSSLGGSPDDTFFLESTDSLSTKLHRNFFTIYNNGFILKIGLPDFLGVALRKADIAAVLLAFASEFTYLHDLFL